MLDGRAVHNLQSDSAGMTSHPGRFFCAIAE